MKKIILILTFSVILISYMKFINQNQLQSSTTNVKRSFKSRFTNAKVIAYCENGKIIYKGTFNDGKKDGEWITYYKCEIIKLKANYKDGKKHGELISYNKNGQIKSKSNYKDGKYINNNMMSRFSY
ncbi:hypothetical protein NRK67_03170 [Fusobacteria bacterium ZRK30]|nr:hypothetical protein NRK67_03170 [Fusobacteria bacterium ZRK30]